MRFINILLFLGLSGFFTKDVSATLTSLKEDPTQKNALSQKINKMKDHFNGWATCSRNDLGFFEKEPIKNTGILLGTPCIDIKNKKGVPHYAEFLKALFENICLPSFSIKAHKKRNQAQLKQVKTYLNKGGKEEIEKKLPSLNE